MHLRIPEACRTTFRSLVLDLTFQSDVHSTYLRRVCLGDVPSNFTVHHSSQSALYMAMGQYSSLCVSAVEPSAVTTLKMVLPDREQVDCEREKVEVGEKQERDKHEETTNARSNM